jgi:uncharacterized protein
MDGATMSTIPPRIFLRPIATPLPIGMLALAVGSLILCGIQLKWIPVAQTPVIALCVLGFVVPLQFIGFLFGLLSRDEGAASAMALLFATWLASGLSLLASTPGSKSAALGLLLVAAAGALVAPIVVAMPTKPLISLVVLAAALRFLLTGIYELGADPSWQTASGIVGLVVVALAWYAGLAFALEAGQRRRILPTLRRPGHPGPAPTSTPDPLGPVSHDAGVRAQL